MALKDKAGHYPKQDVHFIVLLKTLFAGLKFTNYTAHATPRFPSSVHTHTKMPMLYVGRMRVMMHGGCWEMNLQGV